MLARSLAVALALVMLAAPAWAETTRYNPRRAGHPLRVLAYVLHPVGVALDTLIFHPAWWVGTHEPLRTLFGVEIVVDDSAEVAREIADRHARERLQPPAPTEPAPAPDSPTD